MNPVMWLRTSDGENAECPHSCPMTYKSMVSIQPVNGIRRLLYPDTRHEKAFDVTIECLNAITDKGALNHGYVPKGYHHDEDCHCYITKYVPKGPSV